MKWRRKFSGVACRGAVLAATALSLAAVPAVAPAGAATQAAQAAQAADPCNPVINPVVCENSKPGNPVSEWDIDGVGDDTIEGFSTDISVNVGQTVNFKIRTNAAAYTIDIYRTGYYGGNGARKIASVAPSAPLPQNQPACLTDVNTSLVDCGNWGVSASWAVPANAVSGVYIAKLTRADTGGASHIIFIVRNDASQSDLLFQTSDTTWQAYNSWGGYNFYPGPNGRAFKLSYNRPFNTRPVQNGADFYFGPEYAMVRFLERNGYDVSYTTGVDSARRGNLIQNHKTFISVGHDEYWAGIQRTNVEAARDAGVNLAFFSGNEIYWKTRWEPSIDGSDTANRTIVCYKETWNNAKIDPSPEWTGTWRDPRFSPPSDGGRPENGLSGTAYMVNDDDAAIQVPAADGKMRFWRNTSVATQAPGATATLAAHTLGYESDEDLDNGFRPAGLFRLSTTTLAVDQYLIDYGSTVVPGTTTHHLTTYRAPSGALVFGAGTIQWSYGLDVNRDGAGFDDVEDARMQQATVNLLADMKAQPASLMNGLVAASASTDVSPPTAVITSPAANTSYGNGATLTVTGTATDAGGGQVAGIEVSTDGGATWHPATGRASWTYTTTLQGFGAVQVMARAVDDSGNLQPTPAAIPITISCPCTLFSTSDVPALVTTPNEVSPIELGVKFTSSADGWISGVRFYKGATNTGTHTASLWTSNGQRLAQATFANETASGWQTVSFSTPVEVLANSTYVVSYFAPNGGYSSSVNYFATSKTSAPLTAPANGVQGANGVFAYSASSVFPTSGFQATNYWVDPIFTTVGPPDNTPPTVVAAAPVSGQEYVNPATPVQVAFSETVQAATINIAVSSGNGPVTGSVAYDPLKRAATFTPSAPLAVSTQYQVTVSGALDRAGNAMAPVSWSFTTWASAPAPGQCPCTIFGGAAPATVNVNDPTSVELGVKFQASVSGSVSGVSFYKGTTNTGPFSVSLWDVNGNRLATAPSYFDSGTGWQTVYFTTPVAVNAGTTYVASYHTLSGNYSATSGQLGSAITNGPLTALASGAAGGNGVYSYGASAFPTNNYGATSYGVDVVFTVPPDLTPPTVASAVPGQGATSVPIGAKPQITFSEPIKPNTVTATLTGPGGVVATSVAVDNTGTVATLTPAANLAAATGYTLSVSNVQDLAGNTMAAPFTATFTTNGVGTCPCTLFESDAVPTVPAANDTSAVELGTRFTVDANGWITGIRFYKGPGNGGVHTGRLWTGTGTQLATVTFSNETTTGWQTAVVSPAVPVTAGSTYVVSYFAPAGRYAATNGFFASAYVNSPLTGVADGNGGSNGVYSGTQGVFPTATFGSTNYWVDAVFTTVAPPDTFPPTITSQSPLPGASSVPPSTTVKVQFNEPVQPNTVTVAVSTGGNPPVAGTTAYDTQTNTLTFSPTAALAYSTQYSVTVSGATDLVGNVQTTPTTWSFSTAVAASSTCPCSIWPDQTAPAVPSDSDTRQVELGLKFRTDTAGFITGARFYKGPTNTGTHVAHLWTSAGTLLATATFGSESTAGWQQVQFTPAVAVSANTTYVISYFAPSGGFAYDLNYFANNGTDNGVLHALRSGVDGVNGVYTYGPSGSFPTTGSTTNYWVDVVYNQTADVTPPSVSTWSPATNATGVAVNTTVSATLNEPVAPASVAMTLRETVAGTAVAGTMAYNNAIGVATFTPSAALKQNTSYTATITATDLAGNAMAAPASTVFTTVDTTPPTITSAAATGSGTTATVTWTTNEPSTSVVAYGTNQASLTSTATGASGVTPHSVTLTGLTANTRYYYRVTSADPSGNTTTSPATSGAPASYAPTVTPIVKTTVADFAGTNTSTLITNVTGGEVSLNPTSNNSFDGTTLGATWTTNAVATGGSATVAGGNLSIDGISARTVASFGSGTVVEFTGVLGTAANRLVGFGNSTFANSANQFVFSTGAGNQLLAVSRGLITTQTTLTASLATTSHTYRIERQGTSTVYRIDGTVVATHNLAISVNNLFVGGVDPVTGGGAITLDWMRVLPYATPGTFTSSVIDNSAPVAWGAITFSSTLNGGTVTVAVRTGNTPTPDATWTAFANRTSGASVGSTGRYLQYRITLTAPSGALASPTVDSVTLAYTIP